MACDASNEIARSPDNVFHVPVLDPGTACLRVRAGDEVILSIDLVDSDDDPDFRVTEANGTLVLVHGESKILLQDFMATLDEQGLNTVVVTEADRTPIDIAYWLAMSDPNNDIITGP